jgi:hypothetical protein
LQVRRSSASLAEMHPLNMLVLVCALVPLVSMLTALGWAARARARA